MKRKKDKNCLICNKKFLRQYNAQKFCSDLCKLERQKYYYQNRKKYQKEYYQKYKQKIQKYQKKWQEKNKVKCKEYWKKYRKLYKEKINKSTVERRKKNYNIRLKHVLRNRLYSTLKYNRKTVSAINLLGCTIKYLKQYLENQFTKKMNWTNYGKYWEIDHIKSCSSFDLSKAREQKKCFHYKNLRPLTIKENRRRNKKS